MQRLTVDLSELGSERLTLGGSLQPGDIDFSRDDVRQIAVLDWSGWIERRGSEVRFAGEFETEIEMLCVRCLSSVKQSIERRFDLFFETRGDFDYEENSEIELKESETQTAFLLGTELPLAEVIREQILLALPMKPLCGDDCRGLCAMCGQDLNAGSCSCSAPSFHPAFEVLEGLRERLDEQKQ